MENAKPTLEEIESLGMEIKLNPTCQTTQFAHLDNPYAGGSHHMYQNKPESWARVQKSVEEKGRSAIASAAYRSGVKNYLMIRKVATISMPDLSCQRVLF